MATDTLEVFGTEFTGVTGIKATGTNNGTLTYIRPQGTKSISANGSGIDVTEYAEVDVAVPTGTPRTSTDLTVSGDTVTAPAGYYASAASKSVASGTAGTPTATKGSVSNNAISVTPSVTNTTGYITGSTKTGTAVSVSASELVSGSETKTANGTYDVTNLAELVVNVSGVSIKTDTGTFTGNGTRQIDVSCTFEPDIVYVNSDPGTTASSGTVAFIIVRGMMTGTRYRNNSTTNSHYAIPAITAMNTGGSSYSWRSTYSTSTGKVTLYCFSNNARALLTSGRTYSYTFVKYTT